MKAYLDSNNHSEERERKRESRGLTESGCPIDSRALEIM